MNVYNYADILIEGGSRAIECRLAQKNVFSHHCSTFSANDCLFSLNEIQKVYFKNDPSLHSKRFRGVGDNLVPRGPFCHALEIGTPVANQKDRGLWERDWVGEQRKTKEGNRNSILPEFLDIFYCGHVTYQIWAWFETFKGNMNQTNTVNFDAHWTSGAPKKEVLMVFY